MKTNLIEQSHDRTESPFGRRQKIEAPLYQNAKNSENPKYL